MKLFLAGELPPDSFKSACWGLIISIELSFHENDESLDLNAIFLGQFDCWADLMDPMKLLDTRLIRSLAAPGLFEPSMFEQKLIESKLKSDWFSTPLFSSAMTGF